MATLLRSSAVAVAVTIVLTGASAARADDGPQVASRGADGIARQVDAVAPPSEPGGTLAVTKDGPDLTATGTGITVKAPVDASGTLVVSSGDAAAASIGVAIPGGSESSAAVAGDGTITYPGAFRSADLSVEPMNHSVRLSTVIRDASAPTEFAFPLQVPPGAVPALQDDGTVLVTNAAGRFVAGFAAPWAKDATGRNVPTHYRIDGSSLVQVVDHTSTPVTYPVVADPWLWKDLIDSASWTYHAGYGWTLKVVPSGWQRFFNGYLPAVAGWDELYDKYKNRGLNTNLGSMKNQYVCHVLIVSWYSPDKKTWDLDEWRPDVGLTQTINHKCNPGPGGFPGEW